MDLGTIFTGVSLEVALVVVSIAALLATILLYLVVGAWSRYQLELAAIESKAQTLMHEQTVQLKTQLLDRGLSAEEIIAVVKAGASQPAEPERSADPETRLVEMLADSGAYEADDVEVIVRAARKAGGGSIQPEALRKIESLTYHEWEAEDIEKVLLAGGPVSAPVASC